MEIKVHANINLHLVKPEDFLHVLGCLNFLKGRGQGLGLKAHSCTFLALYTLAQVYTLPKIQARNYEEIGKKGIH